LFLNNEQRNIEIVFGKLIFIPQPFEQFFQIDFFIKIVDSGRQNIDKENNDTQIENRAMALCTSSGTVGHSISFGKADSATVIAQSCALADAAATALGNMVKQDSDIEKAIQAGQKIAGVEGIIIIKGKLLGAWGAIELVRVSP